MVNLSPDEVDNGKPGERQNGQSAFGELNFSEYTQGGLGRHLGVFSTIFLMLVALYPVYESANWYWQCRPYYRDGHILYTFVHHQQCWECRGCVAPLGPRSPPGRIRSRSVVGTGMYDPAQWRREGLPGGSISPPKTAGYSDLCRPGRSSRIHRYVSI